MVDIKSSKLAETQDTGEMDCYICGASNASWPIDSRPSENGKPFFPFLEYHTPPENAKPADINGKLFACNVCYSFLIQQWNSYESKKTPLVKRLYWLKHTSLQEEIEQNSFYEKDNSLSESESSSNSYPPFMNSNSHIDTSKLTGRGSTDELENRCLSTVSTVSQDSSTTNSKTASQECLDYSTEAKPKETKITSPNNRKACFICRKPRPTYLLRTLHSRPQLKVETPFYPCLMTLHDDFNNVMDAQGRVLSCEECHQVLFCQWQLFSKNCTPFSERRYNFHSSSEHEDEKFVCFLCGLSQTLPAHLLSSKSNFTNRPYFIFLKNLREPAGAHCIDTDGNVKACTSCSSLLFEQWYLYQKAGVPECDWVFSIINKPGPDSKLVSPANIPESLEMLCFVCHQRNIRKNMTEVYSNPYANMDLSFLERIEKIPGTYFSRKLGQSLVCHYCHVSLKNQWKKFDTDGVQLEKRDYKLHRYEDRELDSLSKCEICMSEIPVMQSKSIYILPRNNKTLPYFPFLGKIKENQKSGKYKVQACKFCHRNLICQWNLYESLSQTDKDRSQRHYKPHHFVCYICGDTNPRSDSKIVDQRMCEVFTSPNHVKPPCAIEVDNLVIVCIRCKLMLGAGKKESNLKESIRATIKTEVIEEKQDIDPPFRQNSDSEAEDSRVSSPPEDPTECAGMKVTATVPPLPSIAKRSQERPIMQNQSSSSRNDDEGSFAAALRKLAQQAIVPAARKPVSRERQSSPSGPPLKTGSTPQESRKSPPSLSQQRQQSQSPFYLRGNVHTGGIPSSLAPVIPPSSVMEKEKAEMVSKGSYGRPPSAEESVSRRLSRTVIPGIFPRNGASSEGLNGCFRPNRDDTVRHHAEKSMRDPGDAESRGMGASSLANGPLNMHGIKDRGSNIGLVHPQPVRKLPDEDPSKSGLLGSGRCNPLEAPSSLFRPPSPTEAFSRYPMMPGLHQHSSQVPCPVHGHEAGHHHGSPGDHGSRAGRLPFEGPGVGGSDFRGIHSHHARLRDEMYNMNRIPIERREPLPNPIIEEDLRRRGYDWPWPMPGQHQMFESEPYRRNFLNGFRGHDHGYKEIPHNQMYYSPHLMYGPEYPLHMDPYAHSSLPHPEVFPRRYPSGQMSPRLMDFYRRERNLPERVSDRSDSRRPEFSSEKPDIDMSDKIREMDRRNRVGLEERRCVPDDHFERKEESGHAFQLPRDRFKGLSKPRDDKIISFPAEKMTRKSPDESHKKINMMERLELITKSSNESGPSVDDIIVKDEAEIEHSKTYVAEAELKRKSPDRDDNEAVSKWPCSDDSDISASDLSMEDMEKKMDYMSTLGLVPHGKRRALEEDYERKRWERKVRKMRGRPKKRRRREHTDDSEGRPCSDLDFYNGPMTRHKQQLLQEQEMLLEQVQKNQEDTGVIKETENEDHKQFSNAFSSCPSNISQLESPPAHFTGQRHHPLSVETNLLDTTSASFSKSSHLLKLYEDSNQRKGFGLSDILRDNKHYSKFNEKTPSRDTHEARELDSYVYGRRHVDEAGSRFRWSGIEDVARCYIAYKNERDIQENRMKKMCERLKNEDDIFSKQRQQLQKDIMVLQETRSRLMDSRQKLQSQAKNLHHALRSMANA